MPPASAVYFDAALVAKFYVNEPGRDAVRRLAKRAGAVATSGIAVAEVAAAFHRKLREDSIDVPVFERCRASFTMT
jgi:predicted nucleic acid-binding protein